MHNYPSNISREQFEIIRPDLEAAKKKLVEVERFASDRNLETTFVIIDSKSIKKTRIRLKTKAMTQVNMTKADVTDRNVAIEMVLLNLNNLSCVKNMLFDSGYSGENFANAIKKIHGSSVEVVKVGKKTASLEKLRTQTSYFNAEDSFGFTFFDFQKILDRFS